MKVFSMSAAAILAGIVLFSQAASPAGGRLLKAAKNETAQTAYDKGFARGVMRGDGGAVRLWNHVLVEDDGPAAGTSNKGRFTEAVYGDRMIKKVLAVDDPRCMKAHVVFMTYSWGNAKKPPLEVTVNGSRASFRHQNSEQYGYIPIEPSWLRKGDNEVTFSCPGAKTPAEAMCSSSHGRTNTSPAAATSRRSPARPIPAQPGNPRSSSKAKRSSRRWSGRPRASALARL